MTTMHVIQRKKQLLDFLSGSVYDSNTVNFWLQKVNPLWSTREALGRIIKKQIIANDVVSLTIHCNQHMQYGVAGQHHPVHVEIHGRRYERTYSLTRLDAHHVKLTLKKIEGGIVSTWLCEQAQVGDILEFGQPYGDMLVSEQPQKQLLFAVRCQKLMNLKLLLSLNFRSGR